MQRDGAVLNMVLRIFLRVIAQTLQTHSPGAAHVDRTACAKRAPPWCTAAQNSTASLALTSVAPRSTNCTSRHWI
jgi:hypothetical protein